MKFKVLEPVYIRSEKRSYKVGDEIYLTNEQIDQDILVTKGFSGDVYEIKPPTVDGFEVTLKEGEEKGKFAENDLLLTYLAHEKGEEVKAIFVNEKGEEVKKSDIVSKAGVLVGKDWAFASDIDTELTVKDTTYVLKAVPEKLEGKVSSDKQTLKFIYKEKEKPTDPKKPEEKPDEPKKEEPKPEPPKEEPKVEEPKPEPVQEPPKEEPKVEEPKPEPKKNCRVVEKLTDAPQLAIIFNNASGMRYTLLESAKKVAIFDEKLRNPAKYGITQQDVYYMYRKPNRSVASKKSVAELINNIPTAVDIGLVELKSCLSTSKKASYATNHGIFTAAQRSTLKAKLNKMQVRENQVPGTPIYEGLQKALTIIDGKEREALIVLITEGNGDCTNRNVCELIKKEAKERPKLKINIVNINSPWHNTDCLAKTTGGEILNGDMTNQVKLTEAIKKSMEPVQQEICDE